MLRETISILAAVVLFLALSACNAHRGAGFSQGMRDGYITGYNLEMSRRTGGQAIPVPYPPPRPVYQVPIYGSGPCVVNGNTRTCY